MRGVLKEWIKFIGIRQRCNCSFAMLMINGYPQSGERINDFQNYAVDH